MTALEKEVRAVRACLEAAFECLEAKDVGGGGSWVRRGLDSLVEYHKYYIRAGCPDAATHQAFLAEVTDGLVKVPRMLTSALINFSGFIDIAPEEDSWWVCQRRSAVQFLLDDHPAALSKDTEYKGIFESIEDIVEVTIEHIKRYGGIAEDDKRPDGFPESHWWWTGNIAYVDPDWVPPPGWPPVRQWHPPNPLG